MVPDFGESDRSLLIALAKQAKDLIDEFQGLPEIERARAAELLAQLQNIVNDFRSMRPAPTFKRTKPLESAQSETEETPASADSDKPTS